MDLKRLIKKFETKFDKKKIAALIKKIDSLIIERGYIILWGYGSVEPLELETRICSKDAFEEGYFDCNTLGDNPEQSHCIYIRPDYAGVEIVLLMNEQYAVSCLIKSAYISILDGKDVPAANQKQIGEFFKRNGFPRGQYINCNFCICNKQ